MKKNVKSIAKMFVLSGTLFMAGTFAGAAPLKPADLAKSGAKFSIQNMDDFEKLFESLEDDPVLAECDPGSRIDYHETMTLAEKIASYCSSDEYKAKVSDLLSAFNEGREYKFSMTEKDLKKFGNGIFNDVIKMYSKMGINVAIPKYNVDMTMNKDPENEGAHTVDYKGDISLNLIPDLKFFFGKDFKKAYIKDAKFKADCSFDASCNFNDSIFKPIVENFINLYASGNRNLESMAESMAASSPFGDLDFEEILEEINELLVKLDYNLSIGMSVNSGSLGGKLIADIHLGVDAEVNEEFIESFMDCFMATKMPYYYNGNPLDAIEQLPIDFSMCVKYYNDAGKETFEFLNVNSLTELFEVLAAKSTF